MTAPDYAAIVRDWLPTQGLGGPTGDGIRVTLTALLERLCGERDAEIEQLKDKIQALRELRDSETALACAFADQNAKLADEQRASAVAQLSEARAEVERLSFIVNDRQERGNELLERAEKAEAALEQARVVAPGTEPLTDVALALAESKAFVRGKEEGRKEFQRAYPCPSFSASEAKDECKHCGWIEQAHLENASNESIQRRLKQAREEGAREQWEKDMGIILLQKRRAIS